MSETHIYHPNGSSYYPLDGDKAGDEVIHKHDEGIDLYVDPRARRLQARARFKKVGDSRPQTCIVVHTWENGPTPFRDLLDELREIEYGLHPDEDSEERRHNIGRFLFGETAGRESVEDKFETIPLLASLAGDTLSDLGLNTREQLVYRILLEEGQKLRVGMTGHPAAAVAANQLAIHWHTSASICVSRGSTSTDWATLQMRVGSEANFDPLDDQTERELRETYASLEGEVSETIYSLVESAVEKFVSEGGSPYEKYSDLQKLNSYVQDREAGPSSSVRFDTESAAQIREKVDLAEYSVDDGAVPPLQIDLTKAGTESPAGRGETRLLDSTQRSEFYRRVESFLTEQSATVKDEMQARTERSLLEPIEDLESTPIPTTGQLSTFEALETQYRTLEAMERLAEESDDVSPPSWGSDAFERFGRRIEQMNSNEYIGPVARTEILETVIDRIDRIKETIRERASDRVGTLLAETVEREAERPGPPSRRIGQLEELRHLLRRAPGGQVSPGEQSSLDQSTTVRVCRLLQTELLDEPTRREIAREQVAHVERVLEELSKNVRECFEAELDEAFERLSRRGGEDYETVGHRLSAAQRACEDGVEVVESVQDQALSEFLELVKRVREHPAFDGDDSRRLLNDVTSRVRDEKSYVEGEIEDQIRRDFSEGLTQIKERVDDNVEKYYRRLSKAEECLREGRVPASEGVEPVRESIERVVRPVGNNGTHEILGDRAEQLRSSLREEVRQRQNDIIDRLVNTFRDEIEEVKISDDAHEAESVFKLLSSAEKEIRRAGGPDQIEWSGANERLGDARKYIKLGLRGPFSESEQKEIRESYAEIVDEVLQTRWEKYKKRILERFERWVNDELREPTGEPRARIEAAESNLERLSTLEDEIETANRFEWMGGRQPTRSHESGTNQPTDFVARVERLSGIGEERKTEFRREAESVLDRIVEEQRSQVENTARSVIEDELERISEHDGYGPRERILSFVEIHDVLRDQKTLATDGGIDQASHRTSRESSVDPGWFADRLADKDRETLQRRIVEEYVEPEVDEWKERVVERVPKLLDRIYKLGNVSQRSASIAVEHFRRDLPDPGEYRDGELHDEYDKGGRKDELLNEAARVVGQFAEMGGRDDLAVVDSGDVAKVERRLTEEIRTVQRENQSNRALRRAENWIISTFFKPFIDTAGAGVSRAVRTVLSGRGLALMIALLAAVVLAGILWPGVLPTPDTGGGGGVPGGTESSEAEGALVAGPVKNLSVEMENGGDTVRVSGSVGESASGVEVGLGSGETSSVSKSPSLGPMGRFQTSVSVPEDASDPLFLAITPLPDGETTTIRWSLGVSQHSSGSYSSETPTVGGGMNRPTTSDTSDETTTTNESDNSTTTDTTTGTPVTGRTEVPTGRRAVRS